MHSGVMKAAYAVLFPLTEFAATCSGVGWAVTVKGQHGVIATPAERAHM